MPTQPFQDLSRYFNPQSSVKLMVFRSSFILIDSGFAVWLYVNPALEYAGPSWAWRSLYVTSCVSANFALTAWSANTTFEATQRMVQSGNWTLYKTAKLFGLGMLGILPSLLPAAAALQLGAGGPLVRNLEALAVLLGNLPLNALAILIFIREVQAYCTPETSMTAPREALLQHLKTHQKQAIETRHLPNLEAHTALYNHLFENNCNEDFNDTPSKCLLATRRGVSLLGFGLGAMDFPAYVISTQQMISTYLTSNAGMSWTISGLSNSFQIYLSMMFGLKVFQTVFDMIHQQYLKQFEAPLSRTLYPKMTLLAYAVAACVSAFSFCTSVQLVKENFNASGQQFLVPFAQVSIIMFNLYGTVSFMNFFIVLFAKYCGAPEQKSLARYITGLDDLSETIQEMSDGDLTTASLALPAHFQPTQDDDSSSEDSTTLAPPPEQCSCFGWFSFFQEEAYTPLPQPTHSPKQRFESH